MIFESRYKELINEITATPSALQALPLVYTQALPLVYTQALLLVYTQALLLLYL
jgi:hypothetical protein